MYLLLVQLNVRTTIRSMKICFNQLLLIILYDISLLVQLAMQNICTYVTVFMLVWSDLRTLMNLSV